MLNFDYEAPQQRVSKEKSEWWVIFATIPGFLMTFGGVFCIIPAFMLNDSPHTKETMLLNICRWMMMLTAPAGFVSFMAFLFLTLRFNKYWVWGNWVFPPFYIGVTMLVGKYSQ